MIPMENKRLSRYYSVVTLLTENRDIVSNIRAFSSSATRFCKVIEVIKQKQNEFRYEVYSRQMRNTKVRDELVLVLLPIASALHTLGKDSGNEQLENEGKCSQKYFLKLTNNEILQKAYTIYVLSMRNLTALKSYGIHDQVLRFLKTRIEEFREKKVTNIASNYFSIRTVIKINGLFSEADELLDDMDSYVEILSDSYTDFCDKYIMIRTGNKRERTKAKYC